MALLVKQEDHRSFVENRLVLPGLSLGGKSPALDLLSSGTIKRPWLLNPGGAASRPM
jgi:hypothetical protein